MRLLLCAAQAADDFTQHSGADVLLVLEKSVDGETVYRWSDGILQPVGMTRGDLVARREAGGPFYPETGLWRKPWRKV